MTARNQSPAFNLPYKELLEKALEAPTGLKVFFPTEAQAASFRFKCYAVRKEERRLAERRFDRDDPRWGTCPFDVLTLVVGEDAKRPGNKWFCAVSRSADFINQLDVEIS